jgi:hypothetical protein
LILGRTASGTLKVWVDRRGLAFELKPPATAPARHVVEAIRRGDVSQMSFGFLVVADRIVVADPLQRTLLQVQLLEISPVIWPAYLATSVDIAGPSSAEDEASAARKRRLRLAEAEMSLLATNTRGAHMRPHYEVATDGARALSLGDEDVRILRNTGTLDRVRDRRSGRLRATETSKAAERGARLERAERELREQRLAAAERNIGRTR